MERWVGQSRIGERWVLDGRRWPSRSIERTQWCDVERCMLISAILHCSSSGESTSKKEKLRLCVAGARVLRDDSR